MSEPYVPRTEDLSGFDIFGRRRLDGTIDVGSINPVNMPAFPEYIEVAGAVWSLEGITESDVPSDHPGFGICWGNYC